MREPRRSGWLVLPAARPPAGRASLGLETGSGHHTDPWRVLPFISELVEGFEALDAAGPVVSCFGSARVPPGGPPCARGVALGGTRGAQEAGELEEAAALATSAPPVRED